MSVSNSTPSAVSTRESSPALTPTNIILMVLLLVQLAVTAYFFWPSNTATTSKDPILPGVSAENVTALAITDNNGRAVSFVKEEDAWTLADSDGYPARSEKITETLGKLLAVTTDRLVTQTAGSHDRLQVADDNYQRKVEVTTPSGTQTLYLGSSSGASATHVRAANSEGTYLTSEIATWELDTLPTTWIEVAYYTVPKEQITEVSLENANGTFNFVRNGEEWTLADATTDEPVASANISTLIDRLTTLNLHSVLGKSDKPEYGLEAPLATITITASDATTGTTTADSKTTTLVIGAKDDVENTYYLKSSDSDFYVRMAAFTGDELVNKSRSDFMVQSTDMTGEAATQSPTSQNESAVTPSPEVSASEVATDTDEIENTATVTATSSVTESSNITETATVTATSAVTD